MKVFDLTTFAPKEFIPGLHAKPVHGDQMTMLYLNMDDGAEVPEHAHVHEQISILLEGAFELTVEGEVIQMKSGTAVVIPSNARHSGRALKPCVFVEGFQPVREDLKVNVTSDQLPDHKS